MVYIVYKSYNPLNKPSVRKIIRESLLGQDVFILWIILYVKVLKTFINEIIHTHSQLITSYSHDTYG